MVTTSYNLTPQPQQTKHWYLPSKEALALLLVVEPQLEEQDPWAYALAADSSNHMAAWAPSAVQALAS